MKTFITIAAAIMAFNTPVMAKPKHLAIHQHAMDPDYYALSTRPSQDMPAVDDCIGLSSGTSGPACGATLTGGPSGGIN